MSIKTESIQRVLRIEGRAPEEAAFWLQATDHALPFHCLGCGKFQFYRQHRIVAMVQDDMSQQLLVPPISPQCQKCGFIMHLHIF